MSRLSVPEHVIARQLGDDCIVLDMVSGTYFGLDAVGARIWQLLTESGSIEQISERLVCEFDVTPQQAASDLARLVAELTANGLLTVE
jgi:hypothetical protein